MYAKAYPALALTALVNAGHKTENAKEIPSHELILNLFLASFAPSRFHGVGLFIGLRHCLAKDSFCALVSVGLKIGGLHETR